MKCDLCNKPAVVHEMIVKHGVQKEVHLCEEHAAASGIPMPGQQQPINQILTQFVISQPEKSAQAASPRKSCQECGMSFSLFRKHGVLGCPSCYEAFKAQLSPLIERAQNGGTHHIGKAPRRAGTSIDRQLQRQRLIKELDAAVCAEQYERAAKIRDLLTALDEKGRAGKSVRPPSHHPTSD